MHHDRFLKSDVLYIHVECCPSKGHTRNSINVTFSRTGSCAAAEVDTTNAASVAPDSECLNHLTVRGVIWVSRQTNCFTFRMDEQRTSGAAGVVEIGHQQPVHAVVAHVGERHGTAGSDIHVYPHLIW